MPRPGQADVIRERRDPEPLKKQASGYDDRGFDDVERNFQEASRSLAMGHLACKAPLLRADGGVQVLSSLQQEPGMAPFCTEYAKLVRAVQQSHGALATAAIQPAAGWAAAVC